jgi:hypothetical protein
MQIRNERSTGNPTIRDEHDHLLYCRMAMLGLDLYPTECGDSETFDKIRRRCASCGSREACAVDFERDPNNPAWQVYCPNVGVFNALIVLTEVFGQPPSRWLAH